MEESVNVLLERFSKQLPTFPDGRTDYSSSDVAPVITVFIIFQNSMLLLKRSSSVSTYKGKWNTVAGYLDNPKQTIFEKILEELHEEVGIEKNHIASYSLGSIYQFTDEKNKKTWIVHPAVVTLLEKPTIQLNDEHTEYRWITFDEIEHYDTVLNLKKSMMNAIMLK